MRVCPYGRTGSAGIVRPGTKTTDHTGGPRRPATSPPTASSATTRTSTRSGPRPSPCRAAGTSRAPRSRGRLPRAHRRGLDRHAPAQPARADGRHGLSPHPTSTLERRFGLDRHGAAAGGDWCLWRQFSLRGAVFPAAGVLRIAPAGVGLAADKFGTRPSGVPMSGPEWVEFERFFGEAVVRTAVALTRATVAA